MSNLHGGGSLEQTEGQTEEDQGGHLDHLGSVRGSGACGAVGRAGGSGVCGCQEWVPPDFLPTAWAAVRAALAAWRNVSPITCQWARPRQLQHPRSTKSTKRERVATAPAEHRQTKTQ